MNYFLSRPVTHHHVQPEKVPHHPVVHEHSASDPSYVSKPAVSLEGLIGEDPFLESPLAEEDREEENDGGASENGGAKNESPILESHVDVAEEEGWITIPYRELQGDWNNVPDIQSLRSLDRSFVFPGEQAHILACLSANKQDTEIITPFKVAAVMGKNGVGQTPEKENGHVNNGRDSVSRNGEGEESSRGQVLDQNGEDPSKQRIDPQADISASESFLRMEDHKRQTEILLQRFKNSHFFVRIAESGEPLWSKKTAFGSALAEIFSQNATANGTKRRANNISHNNAFIDRGKFDSSIYGGAARNSVNCFSLPNGDIVVLLQVNVGIDFLRDPTIEILQFEKYQERSLSPTDPDIINYASHDPCGELLKWLLPLDNTVPPPARSLSPPQLSSSPGIGSTAQKSASSGSQLLSHFRSYSMSSLPQNPASPSQPLKVQSSKPNFDLEDWDQYSSQKLSKSQKTGGEKLLSFRGVSLVRERFSVRCGLEGIYIPGRRWRRKLEIIQPVEIHSFAADCNTDDLICVQIKNVSPEHAPDIVVFIDAITIVLEEASKGGPPSSIPITCIEAGNDHSLPNLSLRRGEEHSFIVKPAPSVWKDFKVHGQRISPSSSLRFAPNAVEGRGSASNGDHYAIMVSCRCNYSESRLFFKQPTNWRPRMSRDLLISVASEMSRQSSGLNDRVSQLPVQVLTLQASNLTSEDLTMTVLAPASFTSPPSVGSLGSSPTSPKSPFVGLSEFTGGVTALQRLTSVPPTSDYQKQDGDIGARSASMNEQSSPISDVIPGSGLGCTHLWLQSRVPLGCVPAQSTATIKLELLPLTDGIITLDTLQINVKEKGRCPLVSIMPLYRLSTLLSRDMPDYSPESLSLPDPALSPVPYIHGLTYIPEHSLRINATSSISAGIV